MTLTRRDFTRTVIVGAAASAVAKSPALADVNDKNPITATITGATPTGYPRTLIEGLNAIVRDAYDAAVAADQIPEEVREEVEYEEVAIYGPTKK